MSTCTSGGTREQTHRKAMSYYRVAIPQDVAFQERKSNLLARQKGRVRSLPHRDKCPMRLIFRGLSKVSMDDCFPQQSDVLVYLHLGSTAQVKDVPTLYDHRLKTCKYRQVSTIFINERFTGLFVLHEFFVNIQFTFS